MTTERKIWKYRFENGGTLIEIPGGSAVLRVAEQGHDICVWAAAPAVPNGRTMRVILVATGDDEPPPNFTHVDTMVNVGGWAVLHAYVERDTITAQRVPAETIETGHRQWRME